MWFHRKSTRFSRFKRITAEEALTEKKKEAADNDESMDVLEEKQGKKKQQKQPVANSSPFPRLIQKIESNNQLGRKEEYLDRLYELAKI